MCRNGDQRALWGLTHSRAPENGRRERNRGCITHSSAPAAGQPSSPLPHRRGPVHSGRPGEGRLGREMWKPLSHKPTGPIPVGSRKEESGGRGGDQNVQIMSQILLPETPANEGSAGSPVSQAQTVYTSVKNTFQKKARKPEENLHRLWKMLSENHINLFSKKVFEVFQSTLGRL